MSGSFASGNVATIQLVGVGGGGESLFTSHAPKPDNLKTVKLTESNAYDLGKYIADKIWADHVEVDISHGVLTCHVKGGNDVSVSFGAWLVEEYDFYNERATFREANVFEREKYNLR